MIKFKLMTYAKEFSITGSGHEENSLKAWIILIHPFQGIEAFQFSEALLAIAPAPALERQMNGTEKNT